MSQTICISCLAENHEECKSKPICQCICPGSECPPANVLNPQDEKDFENSEDKQKTQ